MLACVGVAVEDFFLGIGVFGVDAHFTHKEAGFQALIGEDNPQRGGAIAWGFLVLNGEGLPFVDQRGEWPEGFRGGAIAQAHAGKHQALAGLGFGLQLSPCIGEF